MGRPQIQANLSSEDLTAKIQNKKKRKKSKQTNDFRLKRWNLTKTLPANGSMLYGHPVLELGECAGERSSSTFFFCFIAHPYYFIILKRGRMADTFKSLIVFN